MASHYGEWRKSSYSEANGDCVEAARAADGTIDIKTRRLQASPRTHPEAVACLPEVGLLTPPLTQCPHSPALR
ncbi:DUF397 domain-containing protein [Actinomadura rubrobrunea]|uniref:DUF397 domain-containing protein n=1 Tax=Actinomadura rubrobrunea TaxID=115335 RepID=UPI000A019744|nr:DUF397 domain-containing protein [Actinomadura rubrobrunea]